jgi:altronate dehydratase
VNPAIVISDKDNVATALDALDAGQILRNGEATVTVVEPIPRGHKVALRAIAAGGVVVKYGSAIGTASSDIPAGAHVHTHNVASARGRGDLADPRRATLSGDCRAPSDAHHERGRIAEPPDSDPLDDPSTSGAR